MGRRFEELVIPATLAMTTPAVRMVVVCCSAWPDETGVMQEWTTFYPVLAIIARNVREYCPPEGTRPEEMEPAATHEHAIESGWYYCGPSDAVHFDEVIFTDDGGLRLAEDALDSKNMAFKDFVCPWPVEEDSARLAQGILKLQDCVRRKLK